LGTVAAGLQTSQAQVFVFGNDGGNNTYSNTGSGVGGAAVAGDPGTIGDQRAGGFTTGANGGLVLDHISLVLAYDTLSTTFTVDLYSNSGGAPGAPVASLLGETSLTTGVGAVGTP